MLLKARRKLLLRIPLLAVVIVGGAVYTADGDRSAVMSDKEMARVLGSGCESCYLDSHYDCRSFGALTCNIGFDDCSAGGIGRADLYADRWRYTCKTGDPNDKRCASGTIRCTTEYWVLDNGDTQGEKCVWSDTPPNYAWYWCVCAASTGDKCDRCKWGSPTGGFVNKADQECVAA